MIFSSDCFIASGRFWNFPRTAPGCCWSRWSPASRQVQDQKLLASKFKAMTLASEGLAWSCGSSNLFWKQLPVQTLPQVPETPLLRLQRRVVGLVGVVSVKLKLCTSASVNCSSTSFPAYFIPRYATRQKEKLKSAHSWTELTCKPSQGASDLRSLQSPTPSLWFPSHPPKRAAAAGRTSAWRMKLPAGEKLRPPKAQRCTSFCIATGGFGICGMFETFCNQSTAEI